MEKLNVYLSNLAVLNVKFHNLHWNLVGKQFVQLHQFTEESYDNLFEQYDTVAELLKMRNLFPLARLSDYLKVATVNELDSNEVSVDVVLSTLDHDFKLMLDLATEIRNEADKVNDFVVVSVFEGYVASYQKHLWFLKAIKS